MKNIISWLWNITKFIFLLWIIFVITYCPFYLWYGFGSHELEPKIADYFAMHKKLPSIVSAHSLDNDIKAEALSFITNQFLPHYSNNKNDYRNYDYQCNLELYIYARSDFASSLAENLDKGIQFDIGNNNNFDLGQGLMKGSWQNSNLIESYRRRVLPDIDYLSIILPCEALYSFDHSGGRFLLMITYFDAEKYIAIPAVITNSPTLLSVIHQASPSLASPIDVFLWPFRVIKYYVEIIPATIVMLFAG